MRIAGRVLAIAFAIALATATAAPASAAQPAYGAAYAGESSYTMAVPGAIVQYAVAYLNDGTATWEPGAVGLIVCDPDGTTCGEHATSTLAAADWYAPDVFATVDGPVASGEIGFFTFAVGVPDGTPPGTMLALAGDVGLVETLAVFADRAFHEEVSVPVAGIAARLTISGFDSPKKAGETITMAVDIDDVNVELVGEDDASVVTALLDPASCTGAAGGPVTLGAQTATAADGRAWFTLHSLGAYPGCHVRVSAPGLLASAATITFTPGAPARLDCDVSPATLTQDAFASLAVDVRDLFGNPVLPETAYTITLAKVSGTATALVTADEQTTRAGAAFFTVRGVTAGRDRYEARADGPSLLPAACAVGVIAG